MKGVQRAAIGVQLGLLVVAGAAWGDAPVDGGATVSVQVDPKGDTTLDVKRGSVKVKAHGKETRVAAGDTVRAHKGRPLKRVLAAPQPTAPADGATLGSIDAALAWQKVPGAAKYVVEVASAPELSGAQTRTVETNKTVLHLSAGTWYWHVTALDGDGELGRTSQLRRLTIDTTPPKLKTGKPEWR